MSYYLSGDSSEELGISFKPFKAITRAFTFTPTSFQPKKIFGAIGSLTTTTLTGGLGPVIAPKVFSANSQTMKTLGMVSTAVAAVAGAVVLGPAVAASLGPTLSSAAALAGKAVTGLTTFMGFFNKLSPGQQQQVAQSVTPQQVAAIDAGTLDPSTYLQSLQAGTAPTLAPPPQVITVPAPAAPVQAGMGGIDMNTFLLLSAFGLVLTVALSGAPKPRR